MVGRLNPPGPIHIDGKLNPTEKENAMPMNRKLAGTTGALALAFAAATPPLVMPLAPAHAQSAMPPACQAASNSAQLEAARYGTPPSNAGVIVQMQYIMWATNLLLESLDRSCRDWGDYSATRQQFQNTYNATMQTCLSMASNSGDCRPQPYGG
jgi:hypothetical protein